MSVTAGAVVKKFDERLSEALKDVVPVDVEKLPFREEYEKVWVPFSGKEDPAGYAVTCDGSSQEKIKFAGAPQVYAALAMGIAFDLKNKTYLDPSFDWYIVAQRHLKPTIEMRVLELEVLASTIEKALKTGKKVFVAYDGHLYLRPDEKWLVERRAKEMDMAERYVEALVKLHRLGQDENVTITGRSKDSEINYYHMFLMTNYYAEMTENPKIRTERDRRRIAHMITRGSENAEEMWNMISPYFDLTDQDVFNQLSMGPGYTKPLLLASPVLYSPYEGAGQGSDWWESEYRERIQGRHEGLATALDDYYELPPVALTYWSPMEDLGVFRVDVVMKEGQGGNLQEHTVSDSKHPEHAIAQLNALFREPVLDVGILAQVDQVVHLGKSEFEVYKALVRTKLKNMGFKPREKRRETREKVVRGR